MQITDVDVTMYAHPMVPLHKGRFGQVQQEVSLVRVRTDEGAEIDWELIRTHQVS